MISTNFGQFVDIQVNGYAGVDFNKNDLMADELHRCCEHLERDGVAAILATFVTEHIPTMCLRIRNLLALRDRDPLAQRIIPGLHIEGPFLNTTPGYKGAHPADAMQPATLDAAKQLIDAGGGLVRLLTLAPEHDAGASVITWLKSQNVAIAAGHSNASMDDLKRATDAGLSLFTHLGNGCPMVGMDRHDNIVQRALHLATQGKITPCFIADGVHVPFFALSNYLKTVGVGGAVVVSDAVSPAGLGPGTYEFARWTVKVGPDLAIRSPDGTHLVGSAVTMKQQEANLRQHLGLSDSECRTLTIDNPRRAVGLQKEALPL